MNLMNAICKVCLNLLYNNYIIWSDYLLLLHLIIVKSLLFTNRTKTKE